MVFSKVSGVDLEDEEDERQRMFADAERRYAKAQDTYQAQGSSEEVLGLFKDAERALSPLLGGGGLMALREHELQATLKGRLHQAVVLAHLTEHPGRWPQVKTLVEDVLQFDFNNSHGRWLRGLALFHGMDRPEEAREEFLRAIDCAKRSARQDEADQWEAELERLYSPDGSADLLDDGGSGAVDASSPEAAASSTEAAAPPARADAREAPVLDAVAAAASTPAAPAVKRGFFSRQGKKAEKPAAAPTPPPAAALPAAARDGGSSVNRDGPGEARSARSQEQERSRQREAELEAQCKELERQREELERRRQEAEEALRQETALNARRVQELELRQQRQDQELEERLEALGGEVEALLQKDSGANVRDAMTAEEVGKLNVLAGQLQEQFQAGQTWAEALHQEYVEFSTEVLTLREMSTREFRERREVTEKQVADVRELTQRLGDLKSLAKALRDHVRRKSGGTVDRDQEESDVQACVDSAAEFRRLPWSAKAIALLGDTGVVGVMALAGFMGALLAMGISTELLALWKCRVTCAH